MANLGSGYILFTRSGCCLCEGLAERFFEILPSDHLRMVDVDGNQALQARYGLRVPVLALASHDDVDVMEARPLPPVPPRLRGEQLRAWLTRHTSQ